MSFQGGGGPAVIAHSVTTPHSTFLALNAFLTPQRLWVQTSDQGLKHFGSLMIPNGERSSTTAFTATDAAEQCHSRCWLCFSPQRLPLLSMRLPEILEPRRRHEPTPLDPAD